MKLSLKLISCNLSYKFRRVQWSLVGRETLLKMANPGRSCPVSAIWAFDLYSVSLCAVFCVCGSHLRFHLTDLPRSRRVEVEWGMVSVCHRRNCMCVCVRLRHRLCPVSTPSANEPPGRAGLLGPAPITHLMTYGTNTLLSYMSSDSWITTCMRNHISKACWPSTTSLALEH